MSLQQLLFAFPLVVLVVVWYSTSSLRKKILITYRRVDNTKIEMFVPITSRYVFFDHKRFNIIKKCITQQWYTRGIHSFFPTKVSTSDYVWSSEFPIDPDTGQVYVISPEVRGAMNQEEKFVALNRAHAKVGGEKQTFLQKHGSLIAIGLVLLVGAFLWMQQRGLDASITILANIVKGQMAK